MPHMTGAQVSISFDRPETHPEAAPVPVSPLGPIRESGAGSPGRLQSVAVGRQTRNVSMGVGGGRFGSMAVATQGV